jgi:hypothetical protein
MMEWTNKVSWIKNGQTMLSCLKFQLQANIGWRRWQINKKENIVAQEPKKECEGSIFVIRGGDNEYK